jgi:hypothetical protein
MARPLFWLKKWAKGAGSLFLQTTNKGGHGVFLPTPQERLGLLPRHGPQPRLHYLFRLAPSQ